MTKAEPKSKKPWAPPRLKRYGDLRTLTRGNVRNKAEPSGVKTKQGGPG